LEKVSKTHCSIRPFLKRGLLLALGWKLRETSAARPPPAARVEEACLFVGKKFTVLSLTPETGYEELVVDRESIGSGGTMVGGSSRLGALRAYGGHSWT
jgi:hypothetical protein